jgi:hypothetical protein
LFCFRDLFCLKLCFSNILYVDRKLVDKVAYLPADAAFPSGLLTHPPYYSPETKERITPLLFKSKSYKYQLSHVSVPCTTNKIGFQSGFARIKKNYCPILKKFTLLTEQSGTNTFEIIYFFKYRYQLILQETLLNKINSPAVSPMYTYLLLQDFFLIHTGCKIKSQCYNFKVLNKKGKSCIVWFHALKKNELKGGIVVLTC